MPWQPNEIDNAGQMARKVSKFFFIRRALWHCGTVAVAVAEVASGLVSYSIKFLFDWLPTLAEWALKSEP